MQRKNISSGGKWEKAVGYSRAVRVGNFIEVAGTTAFFDNEVQGKGDPYAQTMLILNKIKDTLEKAGSSLEDVVRTRIYVTDIKMWNEVGMAHGEFFRDIKPASTMLEVKSLIDPELLVEIEASAIIE